MDRKIDEEWSLLERSAKDDAEIVNLGLLWLKKNHANASAGVVMTKLLRIGATENVAHIARRWLRRYADHETAPDLIGAMLAFAPSSEIVKLGIQYLHSTDDLKKIRSIIYAMHERSQPDEFLQAVRYALEKQPENRQWYFSIAEVRNECEPRVEKLILRWIELNYHGELDLLRIMVPTPTKEVFEACFSWIRSRADSDTSMTSLLPYLVQGGATKHLHLYAEIMTFVKAWIERNPAHEDTGSVQQSLIKYSNDDADISAARNWLLTYGNTESAWFAITALLRKDHGDGSAVDPSLTKAAREFLRKEDPSSWKFLAALRVLLLVEFDDELISWVKKCSEKEADLLIPVLLKSADEEIIRQAEKALEQGKRVKRSELIAALLQADPENRVANLLAALSKPSENA